MSHEVESMFSVKETPWHGLGKIIQDAPSIQDGIRLAGLDWTAEVEPLYCADSTMVTHRAIRRSTDKRVLGIVGPDYTPLQNAEAFDWFQPFIDNKLASLTTAGSLRNGERVWVLAEINFDPSEIVKGDDIRKFILLSNGHDGKLAVRIGFTPIRVVCANTLRMSHVSEASKLIRVRHNKGVKASVEKLREVMNLANQEFEATAEQYRFLAKSQFRKDDVIKYVKKMFDIKDSDVVSTKTANILKDVFDKIYNGLGTDIAGVRGSWWSAYNGFNEYLNYTNGRNSDNRLNSLWFGENDKLNAKALELAIEFANAA